MNDDFLKPAHRDDLDPEVLPALLAEVRRLRAENEEWYRSHRDRLSG